MSSDTYLSEIAKFKLAIESFDVHGLLIVRNLYTPGYVESLRTAFLGGYPSYLEDRNHPDALQVGEKRYMVSVQLEPPFDDPFLYGNPFLMPLLRFFLSPQLILGSFGVVASLPGAQDQHVHTDHPGLFRMDRIDAFLPPHAVSVIVPLMSLDESTGTTRMWVGSHRMPLKLRDRAPQLLPYIEAGSAFLMDFRLLHAGTANKSGRVRPIVYNEYCRPWFRDRRNYRKQSPVRITREKLREVSADLSGLFAHVFFPEPGERADDHAKS